MDRRERGPPPPPPRPRPQKATKKRRAGSDESLKVVYISSPMKVRTSAARFRSLVQELTGKNSDIAPYMDSDGGALADYRDEDGTLLPDRAPSSLSDPLLGAVDNVFAPQFQMDMDDVYRDFIM